MADQTNIEWCDSTFNPWIGCTRVSPGCDNCYAACSTPARTLGIEWGPHAERRRTSASTWAQPLRWERQHEQFMAEHGRRRRVFCASLADVFDNAVPTAWRIDLFNLIASTPHLDWLLVTKRIGNVLDMLDVALGFGTVKPVAPWPWPNVWLGVTVTDQREADRDIPKLLAVPARVRFLSMEPLLGPVSLTSSGRIPADEEGPERIGYMVGPDDGKSSLWPTREGALKRSGLHWVIVGGESGPKARPMSLEWARSLRDQCAAAGVPFLFKQWGEWLPEADAGYLGHEDSPVHRWADKDYSVRAGKKAAGRLLDSRIHNEFPRAEV